MDLVLGTNEKFDIAGYLADSGKRSSRRDPFMRPLLSASFNTSYSLGDRTRSFLKVQDGCDYGCSYCTIPLARGQSRNPDIASLIIEAEKIAERGVKEIVLTGVNIGDFGKSTGESFAALLSELVKVQGIERYRISSIEPNLLTDEIIMMAAANEKILPHFHIPLQSGSDKILGLMRRRYTREVFQDRVKMIRKMMPFAGIGADVIVGFPGESHSDFEDTFSFLKDCLSPIFMFSLFPKDPIPLQKNFRKSSIQQKKQKEAKALSLFQKKKLRNLIK